jgi:hypothetical protein
MKAVKEVTNWDVEKVRKDFPVLHREVNGKPLVYLDNAASSQVPQAVIDRSSKYLQEEHSNIHRGVHYLSQHATTAYEAAREKVKRFINAPDVNCCIFVRGCTEGVNLVAHSYGKGFINEGDEIIVSQMEHHSNIIPWQVVAEERGAKIRVIPMNERGELIIDEYENLLNELDLRVVRDGAERNLLLLTLRAQPRAKTWVHAIPIGRAATTPVIQPALASMTSGVMPARVPKTNITPGVIYTRAAFSAASTRAFRKGTRRSRTPVASKIALATAAMVGLQTVSPAP